MKRHTVTDINSGLSQPGKLGRVICQQQHPLIAK